MLYPERMKEVSIVVHADYLNHLTAKLHESGLMEIIDIHKRMSEYGELSGGKAMKYTKQCVDYKLRIDRILKIMEKLQKKKKGLVTQFFVPQIQERYKTKRRNIDKILQESENILQQIEDKILDMEEQLNTIKNRQILLNEIENTVKYFLGMDLDFSDIGSYRYIDVVAGVTTEIITLKDKLRDMDCAFFIGNTVNDKTGVVIVYHKNDANKFTEIVQGKLEKIDINLDGTADKIIENIKTESAEINKKKKTILASLENISHKKIKNLKILSEELGIEIERCTICERFGKTINTYVISGWVPEKNKTELERIVDKSTKGFGYITFSTPRDIDEDIVPVYQKINRLTAPFVSLTNMFAPPKYNEIDPTIFLTFIYPIFFGFMLGDAIYGLLVLIFGLLLYRGAGKGSPIKNFAIILSVSGFSSVIFGILFGSYLGDAITKFTHISIPSLLNPIESPIPILLVSLIVGLIHINHGLVLACHQNYRKRKINDIFSGQVSLWSLQVGGCILIPQFFGWFNFSTSVLYTGILFACLGLALLFYKKKALAFFEITGLLGNWLSYARLLALGLATAGIAMTINIITDMILHLYTIIAIIPVSVVLIFGGIAITCLGYKKMRGFMASGMKLGGIIVIIVGISGLTNMSIIFYLIVFGVFFLFGHLMNCVLQALGSFIHALRLHYVEFFGQFYSGGGVLFKPFKAKRNITILEE